MSEVQLLDLPMELLQQIAALLNNKDFVQFTSTCSRLRQVAQSCTSFDRKTFSGKPPMLRRSSSPPTSTDEGPVPLIKARGLCLVVNSFMNSSADLSRLDAIAPFVTAIELWTPCAYSELHRLLFPQHPDNPSPPDGRQDKLPQPPPVHCNIVIL